MKEGKIKQRLSYAFGALGHDVYYYSISTFFIAFVTAQMFAGSPHEDAMIALVTGLVVIIRLVEIIFDPIIGSIIDNTHTRWGKFKPWLVVGGIMSSLMIMLMFSDFFGLAKSGNRTLFAIVFIIAFIILDAFYSFKDIAFWSMIPALSEKNSERETLGTFARFGSAIGAQGARGFFAFGVIAALVQGISALVTVWGTKEQKSVIRQEGTKTNTLDVFKALLKNDQLMWLSLSYILFAIAYVETTATLILNFTFVIGNASLYSITGIVGFIGSIILVPMFPTLAKKFGRRKVLTGAIISMLVGYVLFVLGNSVPMTVGGLIFLTAPYQLVFLSVLMTITDSVEYGQWKNGVRNEAVTLAMRPLLDKIAGAFSNGIYGFVAIAAGMTGSKYISGHTYGVATFKLYSFVVPAVLMIIALAVYLLKVKLTEKCHEEIVAELEERLK
ncbi:glycoside-pentoside-hexuronide (GPH):cation symporter [Lactococcus cremoris]|uniref:glycoside-pentoside-hexuronide (GPH):cation symporter n=1 Tax=Lactococcus lactis subsp. cremoris TaxID=1359 RepID=UPI001965AB47|nr:glycoside-pentoside-hexuronide (GPH):cation symporter [Lactococcus cremoris]QRZ31600.1 glycoside-pentoside-hexuronide (GPH):cation symporter [Lactococcus cremoris]